MTAWGQRTVPEIVATWRPNYNEKWRAWIRESYDRYASTDDEARVAGVRDFAIIFGDSGAPELCVLVALFGLRLVETESSRNGFESHIRIVNQGLGIEQHANPPPGLGIPPEDYSNRSKWLIDRPAWIRWREHKLQDFNGDRQAAAEASVRLACIHAGILAGDVELTFESLCDPRHWLPTKTGASGTDSRT